MFASLLAHCTFAVSLLLAAPLAVPATAQTTPVRPAAHPSFVVKVVGQGRPVLLIPGLTCPGAVWDETVARYQRQY